VGSAYWAGLLAWFRETLLAAGAIAEADMELFTVTDDLAEVVRGLRTFVEARSAAHASEEA
jgi:hypothetical protein